MRKHDADPAAINRGADLTLKRNCLAFGLDHRSFTLIVESDELAVREIDLAYNPIGGREPFYQRRRLQAFLQVGSGAKAEVKAIVEEMVWNAALAFRPVQPVMPSGWSIHPVAASIVAATGTPLPNPADPLSWLLRVRGELHLEAGGCIAEAVFRAREGVLLLDHAALVDGSGAVVATMMMQGPRTVITLPGAYPETIVASLAGRPVGVLCDAFATDARGGTVSIRSARNVYDSSAYTVVTLTDTLVPLLPSDEGGERWRPRTAGAILAKPALHPRHLLRHRPHMLRHYYALSNLMLRKARRPRAPTP